MQDSLESRRAAQKMARAIVAISGRESRTAGQVAARAHDAPDRGNGAIDARRGFVLNHDRLNEREL